MTLRKKSHTSLKKTPWKKQPKGIPRWVTAIPLGSHGSGKLQRRLWKLVSDYVRLRDYYAYRGSCVATGRVLGSYKDGHAGHFIAYSHCRGIFKFDTRNIHLQHGYSNKYPTRETWQSFEAELINRYGVQYINMLEDENKKTPLKFTNEQIIERMKELLIDMTHLDEQPDYHSYVLELMGDEVDN